MSAGVVARMELAANQDHPPKRTKRPGTGRGKGSIDGRTGMYDARAKDASRHYAAIQVSVLRPSVKGPTQIVLLATAERALSVPSAPYDVTEKYHVPEVSPDTT